MNIDAILAHLLRYVAFAFVTSTAFAGTIDPNTPDAQYIEFGKQFPCVVRIRAEQYQQKDDNTEFPLTKIFVHPDFKEDNLGHFDIALGYSPKDFDLEFYCPLYTDNDELGKAVTIAGYGIQGTFFSGAKLADEKKRAGHNRVEGIERSALICRPSSGRSRFPLEFIITPGDSGGGLFIENKLAGINSFLMATDGKPDGTYTDEAAHTRVSVYADWVNRVIAEYEGTLPAR